MGKRGPEKANAASPGEGPPTEEWVRKPWGGPPYGRVGRAGRGRAAHLFNRKHPCPSELSWLQTGRGGELQSSQPSEAVALSTSGGGRTPTKTAKGMLGSAWSTALLVGLQPCHGLEGTLTGRVL